MPDPIGKGCCGGFVHDAHHFQTGKSSSVARGLALSVIEIRRHGDHRFAHLATELLLGLLLERSQDFLEQHPEYSWQKPLLRDMKAGPWTKFHAGQKASQ